ncbi:hypothetical protein B5180_38975 [Streptomyces sp. BF-3]|nr:hypothetical protein B5180_38975 [Streptomyces sp. BF-3]
MSEAQQARVLPAGPHALLVELADGEHTEAFHAELLRRRERRDLDEVAALWGVGADEVAALHSRTAFRVAFCGFAPGFGYLTGLPERLHVPRRTTPRTRVPAGAVALAGPYTGVYPRPSPGGWQLVGRMPDPGALWDPGREPAALLVPGTPVRFVPVEAGKAAALPTPRAGDVRADT